MKPGWMILIAMVTAAVTVAQPPPRDDPSPTRVTIHARDQVASAVLDDIAHQSGLTFFIKPDGEDEEFQDEEKPPPPLPKITLDACNEPVWSVLTRWCECTGMGFNFIENGVIQIYRPDSRFTYPLSRWQISEAFLFDLRLFEHSVDFRIAPELQDQLNVHLGVFYEPRLHLLWFDSEGSPAEAVDENGLSLVPPAPATRPIDANWTGRGSPLRHFRYIGYSYLVRLHAPPGFGRRIARLRGVANAWFARKSETFEFTDLAVNHEVKRMINGMNVTVRTSLKEETSYRVEVHFDRAAMTKEQWKRDKFLMREYDVRLMDASGRLWGHWASSGSSEGEDERSYDDLYGGDARNPPVRIVVEVFTEAMLVPIAYDMRDLPLP